MNAFAALFAAIGLDDETAEAYAASMDCLAQDIATFHGHNITRVREAVRSALMGEYEPMRSYVHRPLNVGEPPTLNLRHLTLWRLRKIMEATVEAHGYHNWMAQQ